MSLTLQRAQKSISGQSDHVVIPVYDENPTRRRAVVTWSLVALNVIFFLLSPARSPVLGSASEVQACKQQAFFLRYGAIPTEVVHDRALGTTVKPIDQTCATVPADYHKQPILSIFTSMFIHGGWIHLLGNMLFLVIFGNNVEDRLGRFRYLIFYLGIGFISAYAFSFTRASSLQPLVGASGAIAGVLGAYLILFPKVKVTGLVSFLFFFPLRMPAWVVLGLWFVLQAVFARGGGVSDGSVAYLVHVFGFLMGLLYIVTIGKRFRRPPPQTPTSRPPQHYSRYG